MDPVQQEISMLLQHMLDSVFERLEEEDFLHPFALTNECDGPGRMLDADHEIEPEDALELILDDLRTEARAGTLRSYAMAVDVEMTNELTGETIDAVQISIEHLEHEPFSCVAPYVRGEDGIERKELMRTDAASTVFGEEAAEG